MDKPTRGDITESDNSVQRPEDPYQDQYTVCDFEDGSDTTLLVDNTIDDNSVDDGYDNATFVELERMETRPSIPCPGSLGRPDKTSEYDSCMAACGAGLSPPSANISISPNVNCLKAPVGKGNWNDELTVPGMVQSDDTAVKLIYQHMEDSQHNKKKTGEVSSNTAVKHFDHLSNRCQEERHTNTYSAMVCTPETRQYNLRSEQNISVNRPTDSCVNGDSDYEEISVNNFPLAKRIQDDATHKTDSCNYEDITDSQEPTNTQSIATVTIEPETETRGNQTRFGEPFGILGDESSVLSNVLKATKTRNRKLLKTFFLVTSIAFLAIMLTVCFVRLNGMEQSISKLTSKQEAHILAASNKDQEFTSSKNNSESSSKTVSAIDGLWRTEEPQKTIKNF